MCIMLTFAHQGAATAWLQASDAFPIIHIRQTNELCRRTALAGYDPRYYARYRGTLEQGYDLIETIIRQVLGGLSTDKFIYFIESKVEDDLSWIRINGAIVGAVAGLLVWTFLEYVYMPFWQQFVG